MKRFFLSLFLALAFLGARAQEIDVRPVDREEVCLCNFRMDYKDYIHIFNGFNLHGWRGYGKDHIPSRWQAENGAIHLLPPSAGGEGGDLIFNHQFRDFELQLEWKVARGGNSGIFYLGQELADSEGHIVPLFASAPEYQLLDNQNHPDAQLGRDGNRQSASLYDIIPAQPQNQKPAGKWNKAVIRVKDGHVEHYQNGRLVLSYDLWGSDWNELLENSKFSSDNFPLGHQLLLDCGGEFHQGYIGLQDHGDEIWFRKIKLKRI